MSIADNIAFGLKIKNKSKAYIDDIIPLEKRTEYQDILDEKNKQDRKY